MEIVLDFPFTVNLVKETCFFYHNSQTKFRINVHPLLVADLFLGALAGETWDVVSMKAKEMNKGYLSL